MTHDRTPWRLIALLFVILIGFIAFVLLTMSQALAQNTVPRPNTTLQTDLGLGEILTDSVPGEPALPPRPSAAAVPSAPAPVVMEGGEPFDPSAYYRAKADLYREQLAMMEVEARRYARWSARLGAGASNGIMAQVVSQAMAGCSSQEAGNGGFWARVGNRLGRGKECREQQTSARYMMCNLVAVELQNPQIVQHCTQLARADNEWIPFWSQALRAGVTLAGIHYGAGVISDIVGLSAFTAGRGFDAAQSAIENQPAPIVQEPFVVEPFVIEGGGGG